jgi:Resolvase, N terminal domain/Recombinase
MAAKKLATSLMDKGFVREVRAKPGMPAWRRNEDGRTYALVITKLGRAAIRVADEGRTHMDAVKDVGLPGPRTHKGKRPVASTPDSSDALVARAPDQGPARERDAARAQSSGLASQGSQCTGQSINSPRRGTKLQGVGDGRVDVIVVYKVDRLTRSLADFAKLVELFDAHEASFVSVTQAFNTTSSLGRLTLNVLLSFAQFEREVIGERVRDKIAASKRKGLWVGAPVPLGYWSEAKKLVVVPTDAEAVRTIFRRYLALGSLGMLIDDLDRLGIKPRDSKFGRFVMGPLAHILKNRFYVGEVAYRGEVHEGEHPPIIDKELFQATQAKLQARAVDHRVRWSRSPSFLSGLIYDDRDNRMSPSHANKRGVRYRYYVSQALLQNRDGHRTRSGGR